MSECQVRHSKTRSGHSPDVQLVDVPVWSIPATKDEAHEPITVSTDCSAAAAARQHSQQGHAPKVRHVAGDAAGVPAVAGKDDQVVARQTADRAER